MAIRLFNLSSGSKGNSTFVDVDGDQILIDCGLTYKSMKSRLYDNFKAPEQIHKIFVSHSDHSDHYKGCKLFQKYHGTHVYGYGSHLGNMHHGKVVNLPKGGKVTSFDLMHDVPTCGFLVEDSMGRSLAYVSDTGSINCSSLKYLVGVNCLLIESNHDIDMVIGGPYPDNLKERINETHLENSQAHDIIKMIDHPGLDIIIGIHLSGQNNSEKLARYELESATKHAKVYLGKQNESTVIFTVL